MFTIPKQIVLPVGEYANLSDILKISADKTSAHIVKYMNFKAADLKDQKIYLAKGFLPKTATVSVPLGSAGDSMRLKVDIVLNGKTLSAFARASTINKGKPLTIEYPGGLTVGNAVEFFNNILKGTLMEEFVRFKKLDTKVYLDCKKGYVDLVDFEVQKLVDGEFTTVQPISTYAGTPGFGTYEFIVENLHLPTAANTNPWGEIGWGMPTPGILYDQYTFSVITDRGPMGLHAVGQDVKSCMTYCIYVPQSGVFAGDAFKTALESLVIEGELKVSVEQVANQEIPV